MKALTQAFSRLIYRPRSVFRLVLVSFAVVILPLIAAVTVSAIYVGMTTDSDQRAFERALALETSVQRLHRHLREMVGPAENTGGPAVPDAGARGRHVQLWDALLEQAGPLPGLAAARDRAAGYLDALSRGGDATREAFRGLEDAVADAVKAVDSHISGGAAALDPSRWRNLLPWLLVVLVPLTMVMAGVFAVTIATPLKDLHHAISQLGEGDYASPIRVSGTQDITYLGSRLEWLRVRLAALEQEQGLFLGRVSHDLKTPLASIREGADLLAEEVVGRLTPEQRDVACIVRDSGHELGSLIEQLLCLSTAAARDTERTVRPVNLAHLVKNVLRGHRLSLQSRGLALFTALDEVELAAEEGKLALVVDNLLSNAVKYSPTGGTVSVKLRRVNGSAVLDVTNLGSGFAECDKVQAFDPFYRGKDLPKGTAAGSGLGLAIAREIVRTHRGSIEIVDETEQVAHLRVTLPLAGG